MSCKDCENGFTKSRDGNPMVCRKCNLEVSRSRDVITGDSVMLINKRSVLSGTIESCGIDNAGGFHDKDLKYALVKIEGKTSFRFVYNSKWRSSAPSMRHKGGFTMFKKKTMSTVP